MVHYDGYGGAMIFFTILQWLTALGRCAIRIFIVRKFGFDDVAMLITLLLSTAYAACFFAVTNLTSGGQVIWKIDVNNLFPATNTTLALLVLYILGTMMLKVALGLLLLRVLVKRWQVLTIWVVMAVSVVYGIFYFFFILFECGVPGHFAIHIIAGQCLSPNTINGLGYAHGVIVAVSDVIFALLPIALIHKTDMSRRSKISVAMILSLGSVGCICTFVRLGYIHLLSTATWDWFHTSRPVGLLSGAELSIGITCLSLSCYKPLVHKLFPRNQTYYLDTASSGHRKWQGSHRHSDQPLRDMNSYPPTASTMSAPTSRHGALRSNPRRSISKHDHDWPMKSAKYSTETDSALLSPITPVNE